MSEETVSGDEVQLNQEERTDDLVLPREQAVRLREHLDGIWGGLKIVLIERIERGRRPANDSSRGWRVYYR